MPQESLSMIPACFASTATATTASPVIRIVSWYLFSLKMVFFESALRGLSIKVNLCLVTKQEQGSYGDWQRLHCKICRRQYWRRAAWVVLYVIVHDIFLAQNRMICSDYIRCTSTCNCTRTCSTPPYRSTPRTSKNTQPYKYDTSSTFVEYRTILISGELQYYSTTVLR